MKQLQSGDAEKERRALERRQIDRRDIDPPPVLKWSERFSTGIRAIDTDHRGLFEMVAVLREEFSGTHNEQALSSVIDGLKLYVTEHFAHEEMFMEKADYPDLETHKNEHRQATRYIHELEKLYSEDPQRIDGQKVINFFSGWLSSHILGSDMKYIPYLVGENEADESEEPTSELEVQNVELRLASDKASAVREFARLLNEGGRISDALLEVVGQFANKRRTANRDTAIKLFCKSS